MSWFKEDNLRRDENGYILRKDQDKAPELEVGDRFFDVANGRWGLLLRILPQWEQLVHRSRRSTMVATGLLRSLHQLCTPISVRW
jgi:hypothetical protein